MRRLKELLRLKATGVASGCCVLLLTVRGDAGLRGVDWPLRWSHEVAQVDFVLLLRRLWQEIGRVSDIVEVRVSQGLFPSETVGWVHPQETCHEGKSVLGELASVLLLKRL